MSLTTKIEVNYLKRIMRKKMPELFEKIPDLSNKIEKCTKFKLKPDLKVLDDENPIELWFNTKDDLLFVMKYLLENYLSMEIIDWNDSYDLICRRMGKKYHYWMGEVITGKLHYNNKHCINIINMIIQFGLNLSYIINLFKKDRTAIWKPLTKAYSVIIGTFIVSPLILLSVNKNNIDRKYFSQSVDKIKYLFSNRIKYTSWDDLRSAS